MAYDSSMLDDTSDDDDEGWLNGSDTYQEEDCDTKSRDEFSDDDEEWYHDSVTYQEEDYDANSTDFLMLGRPGDWVENPPSCYDDDLTGYCFDEMQMRYASGFSTWRPCRLLECKKDYEGWFAVDDGRSKCLLQLPSDVLELIASMVWNDNTTMGSIEWFKELFVNWDQEDTVFATSIAIGANKLWRGRYDLFMGYMLYEKPDPRASSGTDVSSDDE